MLIWMCAARLISQIIRSNKNDLASSKNDYIDFTFKHSAITTIKLLVNVADLDAFLGAFNVIF